MEMTKEQLELIANQLATIKERSPFYAKKFEGIDVTDVRTQADFEKLPFSEKDDLRAVYPLGLQAVPDEEVVRIHSSSGTTGTPVIIPYTQQDVIDWAMQFARCYEMAGITPLDRIQITPGYGLWTAGIGFQLGAERLGAMAIPMGPGNTEKQLKMMQDLKSTVICATSSYALLLAEEITKRNLRDKIHLKKGVIGSERWGEKMRNRIQDELGIEIYDIYGLTEVYGPGIGISCDAHDGMHIWDDFVYIEIVDPETGEVLPDDIGTAWSGTSYQEANASKTGGLVYLLALVFVFLALAALYESWGLPLAILMSVPAAVLGAVCFIGGAHLLDPLFINDIYMQISLVMLIGLAAKNAILVVEYADRLFREKGLSLLEAAVEAARIRLRPIIMTAFAFILGVMPLIFASGVYATARNIMGVALVGGMLFATLLGIFIYPALYYLVGHIGGFERRRTRSKQEEQA